MDTVSFVKSLKQRLEEYRVSLNLTQNGIANAIGLTQSTYTDFINEGKTISKVVPMIIEAYPDLNCNWLFRGEGNMSNDQAFANAYEAGSISAEESMRDAFGLPDDVHSKSNYDYTRTHAHASAPQYPHASTNPQYAHASDKDQQQHEVLQVAEGERLDIIWYNVLLRENDSLKREIELLRSRNIELERRTAVAEDRFSSARKFFHEVEGYIPEHLRNKKG